MLMAVFHRAAFDRSGGFAAVLLLTIALSTATAAARDGQTTYGSPQETVDALATSVRSGNLRQILKVLGPEARDLASSGDSVADAAARARFVAAFDESHEVRQSGDGAYVLYLGSDDYPFPLRLVAKDGKWRFDTATGAQEILDRRIGANELAAIEVMKAFVDAEREYAEHDRDGKGPQYARRLLSGTGKTDGLYWPTSEGEAESPLGQLIAQARAEGYRAGKAGRTPYHGYLFRILTAQGKSAAGGARDYIVGGRMIAGFALLASPAEYGSSGIMTFMVNQDGAAFETDLGQDTERLARQIITFDPSEGWTRVVEP